MKNASRKRTFTDCSVFFTEQREIGTVNGEVNWKAIRNEELMYLLLLMVSTGREAISEFAV